MVKFRDNVPDPIKKLGQRLKRIFQNSNQVDVDEREAEAARRRFEKAVFHSQYSVDQFEAALDEHRHKMQEIGEAITDCIKQIRKHWRKAEQLGPHRGKHHQAIAKTWFKRLIALEERIDAHLEKFEEKLDVLTAWRQYKIQNDIGAEVNVAEVKQFMADEFDQFELDEQSFEEQEAEAMTDTIRIGPQDTVSGDEQELFGNFVENEFGSAETTDQTESEEAEDEEKLWERTGSNGGSGNGHSGDPIDPDTDQQTDETTDDDIDDELTEFLENEGFN